MRRVIICSLHIVKWAYAGKFSYTIVLNLCSSFHCFHFLERGKAGLERTVWLPQKAHLQMAELRSELVSEVKVLVYFPCLFYCSIVVFSLLPTQDLFLDYLSSLYLLACTNNEDRFIFSVKWHLLFETVHQEPRNEPRQLSSHSYSPNSCSCGGNFSLLGISDHFYQDKTDGVCLVWGSPLCCVICG